ncbi:MAG: cobalamin-binding protein [Candidatus Margulisiibacteriota bacterium]
MQKILLFALITFLLCSLDPSAAKTPMRIISGMPSITEILYAIGAEKQIVGVTNNCNYPPQAKKKEKIGGFFLNLEKIISLKPTLILMSDGEQSRDIEKLKKYGFNVKSINPKNVEDVLKSIIYIGKEVGKEGRANSLVSDLRYRLTRAKPNASFKDIVSKRPKVLVMVGYNPIIVAGGKTFVDNIIKLSGAENICGSDLAPYPQISFEKLVNEDPEYLIIPKGVVSKKEIDNDGRWKKLAAIRSEKILFINPDILSRTGPRVVDAVEEISKFIYR